jgi:cytochrome P450
VTQRDPRWFPEPERFDPDRFAPDMFEQVPPVGYFRFGGGPRLCIGQAFAMMEMTLVTATLLAQLRPELAPGQGEPVLQAHLSLRPKGGLRLRWMLP